MRRQRDIFQSREDKTSEKVLNEIEIINLPNKEFKVQSNGQKDAYWAWRKSG